VTESANPSQIDHEARHRAVVQKLVAELRPVRRIWPVSARLAIWLALETGVLFFVLRHTNRTDLAQQFRNPWFLFAVGGFAVAGAFGGALALRSAIPGREPRRIEIGLLFALTIASALSLLHEPIILAMPIGTFIHQGLPCLFGTVALAVLPLLALFWAVRRGAPLAGGIAGALAGAGAFLFSYALMRVNCPIDEGLHLFMWHFLPALIGVALSAGAGFLLFRKRSNAVTSLARRRKHRSAR
jgi:LPXTG-motif cell wall-anchored protein